MEFGDDGELVNLTENQSVNVISPSIISANDNSDPSIEQHCIVPRRSCWRKWGTLLPRGDRFDIDFNIVSVVADTTSIGGLAQLTLNDRGLNGDRIIGDDIWTAEITVLNYK